MGWIGTKEYLFAELDRMNSRGMSAPRRQVIFRLLMRKSSPQCPGLRAMRMRERLGQRRFFCPKWQKKSHDLAREIETSRVRLHRRAMTSLNHT